MKSKLRIAFFNGKTEGVISLFRRFYRNLIYRDKPPIGSKTTKEYLLQSADSSQHYKLLHPEHLIVRESPRSLSEKKHDQFEKECSHLSHETFVATIPTGRVYGYGVVITPDNYVLKDVSIVFEADASEHRLCRSGNLPCRTYINQNVAVLSSTGSETYFHWLFDVLPRLQLIEECAVDLIYINSDKKFQQEYLNLFGIPEQKILPATKTSHIQAKNLVVPSLAGKTGNMTKASCLFLRTLLNNLDGIQSNKRRIYLTREDAAYRKVSNETDVFQILQKYSFEKVSLSGLSVREQIEILAFSEVVIGPHGAGFSNLVFCSPGTKIIEFFAPTYINICYWALAEQCQLEYYYLLGKKSDNLKASHPQTSDIFIAVNEVSKLLTQIL